MKGRPLTDREARACRLLVDGLIVEQIDARMGVSKWTAWSFLYRARQKLGAASLLRLAVLFDRMQRG